MSDFSGWTFQPGNTFFQIDIRKPFGPKPPFGLKLDYPKATGSKIQLIEYQNRDFLNMTRPDESNLATKIEAQLKRGLTLNILTPNLREIWDYLLYHGDILNLVDSASELARHQFPLPDQLSLEIFHDQETFDTLLTLYIRQKQYAPDIMERIDLIRDTLTEIRTDWFIPFFVTTDFQFPIENEF